MNTKAKSTEHSVPDPVSASVLFFTDMALQGVQKFVDAQKHLLDLTVEQSALITNATKDYTDATCRFAAILTGVVRQSTERAVAAGKSVLESAAKQNAFTRSASGAD
ncbi:MAG: hypothetical protein LAP39_08190 [Acidobacteriia bacterium]|jgi:hypothetical protein|nr:hypothetical protein [Terriglobia bacterium]